MQWRCRRSAAAGDDGHQQQQTGYQGFHRYPVPAHLLAKPFAVRSRRLLQIAVQLRQISGTARR